MKKEKEHSDFCEFLAKETKGGSLPRASDDFDTDELDSIAATTDSWYKLGKLLFKDEVLTLTSSVEDGADALDLAVKAAFLRGLCFENGL